MNNFIRSTLHDEKTFYHAFMNDLERCSKEVIIESPYITHNRMKVFYPIFEKLLNRRVKIYVVTRTPKDHENESLRIQSTIAVHNFERMGVQALLCLGNHHRKLAMNGRKFYGKGALISFHNGIAVRL